MIERSNKASVDINSIDIIRVQDQAFNHSDERTLESVAIG